MCEFCNLEKRTKWYYEDDEFIILDCETCKIPMIVSKEHADDITSLAETYIRGLIKGIFKKKFHFRDDEGKDGQGHWHWHIILEE
jgi:hypothetical protein